MPYEYWISNIHTVFTQKMKFLRPTVFHLIIKISNRNFQSVIKKSVHHEALESFSINVPPILTKIPLVKIERLVNSSHLTYSKIGNCHIQLV